MAALHPFPRRVNLPLTPNLVHTAIPKSHDSLAPGETAIDDSSRCGCARLAQGSGQGLPDAHKPHSARGHGE